MKIAGNSSLGQCCSTSRAVQLKQSLIDGAEIKGARVFTRSDLGMIELYGPDIDALGYVSTNVMNEKVRIKLSEEVSDKVGKSLDKTHNWHADFETETEHYVIDTGRFFHITDRTDKKQYDEATAYGITTGIPDYEVDFSPHLKQWER